MSTCAYPIGSDQVPCVLGNGHGGRHAKASTDQQYRVIGKSGPGVYWSGKFARNRNGYVIPAGGIFRGDWNAGVEILEAISPPQAEVAACESWCGLPLLDMRVPPGQQNWFRFDACAHPRGCSHHGQCPCYCTQACLDRAKAAPLARCAVHGDGNCSPACDGRKKAPECIRSECKAPPVAGGELCAAHAGQVEAAKRGRTKCCAWQVNGGSACGRPADVAPFCRTHHDEAVVELHRGYIAASREKPAETRLERWRREHKGYSHGAADPRIHDANVAAMMMGIDGPREPYVPPPKLPPWTPRDVDGDIPNAWDAGGAKLR